MVVEKKIEISGSDLSGSNCSSPQKARGSGSPGQFSNASPTDHKSRDTSLDSLVEAMDISSSSSSSAAAVELSNSSISSKLNGHCPLKRPNSDEKSESDDSTDEMTGGGDGERRDSGTFSHHNHHYHHQDSIKVKRNSVTTNGHEEEVDILAESSLTVNNSSSMVLFPQASNKNSHFLLPQLATVDGHVSEPPNTIENSPEEQQPPQQRPQITDPEDIYIRAARAEAAAEAAESNSEFESESEAEVEAQKENHRPTPTISILLNEEDKSAFNSSSQSLMSNGIINTTNVDEPQQLLEEFALSTDNPTITVCINVFSQIIELPLSKLKNNTNEFPNCLRIYLYISDVFHSDSKYEPDSMELYFQTTDQAFNEANCPKGVENPVYKLSLSFPHGIVPKACSHKVKKKSIEIHLDKAKPITWGNVGVKCRSTLTASPTKSPNSSKNVSTSNFSSIGNFSNASFSSSSSSPFKPTTVASFAHNKWTPFATSTSNAGSSSSSDSDSLIGIDSLYRPHNYNSLALVTYEEPVEPLLNLEDASTRGKFYGYTGLDNLGNTCFMNSVLQCLSNTYPLRDYFLSGQFCADINPDNPLGTQGVIARAFAYFLKQMWLGKQSSFAPTRIKSLTGEKITSIFLGYGQHDAQEFMSFFLDAIHEDLNQNQNRPKIDLKKEEDNPEKDLFDERDLQDEHKRPAIEAVLRRKADDSWREYRLFNSSLVIDLFCGQYQSVLSCPDCNKKSIMFDPFLYIPLPIPPAKVQYEVIFFGREEATGMCSGSARYEFLLAHNATAGDLLGLVSAKAGVAKNKMRLIEQQEDHISPKFLNSHLQHLSDLRNDTTSSSFKSRPLLVFEVHKDSAEEVVELCVIQRSLEKMQPRRFLQFSSNDPRVGLPFIITVKRSQLTYHHLCTVICSYAAHSVSAYRTKRVSRDVDPNGSCPNTSAISGFRSASSSKQVYTFYLNEFLKNFTGNSETTSLNSMTSLPPLPHHFVHFETTLNALDPEQDLLAPFIIRKPNFGGGVSVSGLNKPEEPEIAPPLIQNTLVENEEAPSDDSDMSDASEASTVVGNNSSSADEEFQQQTESNCRGSSRSSSSGFKSTASSEMEACLNEEILEKMQPHQHLSFTEQPASMQQIAHNREVTEADFLVKEVDPEDEDEEEIEEDEEELEDEDEEVEEGEISKNPKNKRTWAASAPPSAAASVQFDSDALLELDPNSYYICADWIDVPGFPYGVGVCLTESIPSCGRGGSGGFMSNFSSRSLLFGSGSNNENEDDDITLDDCFQLFSEPEVLGQQNCWKCPACRAPRAATKQLSFNLRRLPPVLVVQLKRFKMQGPLSISRRKLQQLVRFPIRGLDLRKMQKESDDLCGGGSGAKEEVPPSPVYDLYAVVNHKGDAFGGHYTAYARAFDGEMGWRHFDDSRVSDVKDETRIVSSNAYLLFYKRREKESEEL